MVKYITVEMRIYDEETGHYVSQNLRLPYLKNGNTINKIIECYGTLSSLAESCLPKDVKLDQKNQASTKRVDKLS